MSIKRSTNNIEELWKGSLDLNRRATPEKIQQILATYNFQMRPSDLYLEMLSDVLDVVILKPMSDVASPSLVVETGICTATVVSTAEDCVRHYAHIIANAESEILLGASFWHVGTLSDIIKDALCALNQRVGELNAANGTSEKVNVKIIFDGGPRIKTRKIVKTSKFAKLHFPEVDKVPNLNLEVMRFHQGILGAFHGKFMVVDRKIALSNSGNVRDTPNLEFCVQLEGSIVNAFYDLFMKSWLSDDSFILADQTTLNPSPDEVFDNQTESQKIPDLPDSANPIMQEQDQDQNQTRLEDCPGFLRIFRHKLHDPVPMVMVNRPPHGAIGHSDFDTPQNAAWLAAFKYARKKIFIQTPMLNAKPILSGIIDAISRGVKITVWLDWNYDGAKEHAPFQGGSNTQVVPKLRKKLEKIGREDLFELRWYTAKDRDVPKIASKMDRNCHVKYMAVDDEVAIIGSGNLDTQSVYHSMEVNVMFYSPTLIQDWKNILMNNQNTETKGKNLPDK